jgi:hypothetical protein|tara:strand:+ start:5745 stop:5909 length:165 start_codon:yes stop_codon:yes gene_type:complete
MEKSIKSNTYANTSLLLTTIGTLLSIQKPVYYLDIIILVAAIGFGVAGAYKHRS